MSDTATEAFRGVVYRGISGLRPLWWSPNVGFGRWHGGAQRRPVQYLHTHPMGPLAEQARHASAHTADELRQLRRTVFALRLSLDHVLRVDFDDAARMGLAPADLVGPPASYPRCAAWLATMLGATPHIDALLTPSAALPGTRALCVLGGRHPFPYDETPRRTVDIPCAPAAAASHAVVSLSGRIVPLESDDHPALSAWRQGAAYTFLQPRTAV